MKFKLLLTITYLLISFCGLSQTTSVYYDNFSAPGADWSQFTGVSPGTSGTPQNTNWTMTSTSGGFGHGVDYNAGYCEQQNNYNGTDQGFSFIYKAADNAAAATKLYETGNGFRSRFDANDSLIVWTFNFRPSSTPNGFTNGTLYGGAFVLGTNNSSFGVGCGVVSRGYAVAWGDGTSVAAPDHIRLVSFINGCPGDPTCSPCGTADEKQYGLFSWTNTNSMTTMLCASSLGNPSSSNWYSVKVTYNPTNNEWHLYARNDGNLANANGLDPKTLGSANCTGSVINNDHTGVQLPFMGMYTSFPTSTQYTRWDNIGIEQTLLGSPAVPGCGSTIGCATKLLPVNGGSSTNFCSTTFSWSPVTGVVTTCGTTASASGYSLSYGTNVAGTNILNNQNVGNVTNYGVTGLLPNTTYYWNVTAYNASAVATGCTTFSFTTGNITAPNNISVCDNGSGVIFSNNTISGETIQWQVSTNSGGSWNNISNTSPYSGVATNSLTINPITQSMNGYQYQAVITQGACTYTTPAALLSVNLPPSISSSVSNTITCVVSSVNVNATTTMTPVSYNWTGPGITSASNISTITVNAGGTYNYTVTNTATGCRTIGSQVVTQNSPTFTVASVGTNSINCAVTTAAISASTSATPISYNWSGPGIVSGNGTPTINVNQGGTYNYTATNTSNGCTSTGSFVQAQNITTITIGSTSSTSLSCITTTANAIVTPVNTNTSVVWSGPGIVSGNNTPTITVNTSGVYTYTVTQNNSLCTSVNTVAVISNTTPPVVTASLATVITCTSTSATLQGGPLSGVTYSWSGAGLTGAINQVTASITAPGTYTLLTTSTVNGCTNTAVVTPTANLTPPQISVSPDLNINCANPTATLSGSSTAPGATYAWTGPTTATPAGSTPTNSTSVVSSGGSYTLTVTDPVNACTSTGVVAVSSNFVIPDISVGSTQTITCSSPSVTLAGVSSTPVITYCCCRTGWC